MFVHDASSEPPGDLDLELRPMIIYLSEWVG